MFPIKISAFQCGKEKTGLSLHPFYVGFPSHRKVGHEWSQIVNSNCTELIDKKKLNYVERQLHDGLLLYRNQKNVTKSAKKSLDYE